MWKQRLSNRDQERLLDAYKRGVRVTEIAKTFGVHHSYASLLARRRGIPTRMNKTNVRYNKEKDQCEPPK
jgi:hypothetical protein